MNTPAIPRRALRLASTFLLFAAAGLLPAGPARAHCDAMDGPVITTAQKALEDGVLQPVLIWVRAEDEAVIRGAFESARKVRALGPEARKVADQYFFETLVRVHRAGEGEPFTGLKPAGAIEPAYRAADQALESGSSKALAKELNAALASGLERRFERALHAKHRAGQDLAAGRAYVAAYVAFLHYVEKVHEAAAQPDAPHGAEEGVHGHSAR